jgi:hypothetical protein
MLPSVDFCGLTVTRLVIGANPFGGYSHQNPERDREMRTYYTIERIRETWARAEAAGINTMVTNNETPHVLQAVRTYLGAGGRLQWIAQVNATAACRPGEKQELAYAVDAVVEVGCKALYFHGALVDDAYRRRDADLIRSWCETARARGIPVGVAGHAPEAHLWVNDLDVADFHAVCFFNCGSLHTGSGDKFRLADMQRAVDAIRRIQKPVIGYKIMGAGRIEARMAFEYVFSGIKATDVVNVGMHRGDNEGMVEENAALVAELLGS